MTESGLGRLLVAIDAGGSVVKATAFDPATARSWTVARPVPLSHPSPGQSERDPEALWAATAQCLRELLAGVAGGAARVGAVGLTAHGNGVYLVDEQRRPTRPAIMAADTRAASLVRGWIADGLAEPLQARSWNGLWAGQPGPILAVLARDEPEVLAASVAALSCKDYLWAQLTGVIETELSAASAGALYDSSAWAAGSGSLELNTLAIDAFGIGRWSALLRTPVPAETVRGVTPEAAAATGLLPGTPVVAGVVDNAAMQHGSGVFDGSVICVGAGTWSINQILVPAADAAAAAAGIRPNAASIALGGMALLSEASPTSASNLDWALRRAIRGDALADRQRGADIYQARLEREQARLRRLDDPMFLPFVDGSRADAGARGAWVGVSSANGEDELLGAVIEGICFEHRRHVERLLAGLPGRPPVRLSGGATKSAVWCQRFADALGAPVQTSPIAELGSVCAAAMAGVAVGRFNDVPAGVGELNPSWDTYWPDPEAAAFAAARYARYAELARHFETLLWEV